ETRLVGQARRIDHISPRRAVLLGHQRIRRTLSIRAKRTELELVAIEYRARTLTGNALDQRLHQRLNVHIRAPHSPTVHRLITRCATAFNQSAVPADLLRPSRSSRRI